MTQVELLPHKWGTHMWYYDSCGSQVKCYGSIEKCWMLPSHNDTFGDPGRGMRGMFMFFQPIKLLNTKYRVKVAGCVWLYMPYLEHDTGFTIELLVTMAIYAGKYKVGLTDLLQPPLSVCLFSSPAYISVVINNSIPFLCFVLRITGAILHIGY